jgi:hypothetical protein
LEREKWDKDDTENGGVGQEARQRATEVGETCRDGLTLEPGPDRSLNDVKRGSRRLATCRARSIAALASPDSFRLPALGRSSASLACRKEDRKRRRSSRAILPAAVPGRQMIGLFPMNGELCSSVNPFRDSIIGFVACEHATRGATSEPLPVNRAPKAILFPLTPASDYPDRLLESAPREALLRFR